MTTFEQALKNLENVYNGYSTTDEKEDAYNDFCTCYPYYDTLKLDTILNI